MQRHQVRKEKTSQGKDLEKEMLHHLQRTSPKLTSVVCGHSGTQKDSRTKLSIKILHLTNSSFKTEEGAW